METTNPGTLEPKGIKHMKVKTHTIPATTTVTLELTVAEATLLRHLSCFEFKNPFCKEVKAFRTLAFEIAEALNQSDF